MLKLLEARQRYWPESPGLADLTTSSPALSWRRSSEAMTSLSLYHLTTGLGRPVVTQGIRMSSPTTKVLFAMVMLALTGTADDGEGEG